MNAPLPMFSLENEQCVIGALLLDNDAIDFIGELKPEHFFIEENRLIYTTLFRMVTAGKGCDAVTLAEELVDRSDGENWLAIVGQMAANTPSARNIGRYAQIVIDRATERALLDASGRIGQLAGGTLPTNDKVDQAQALVMALADNVVKKEGRHINSILIDVVSAVEKAHAGDVVRHLTGYTDIDRRVDMLTPGDFIVVAGRPAMGKAQPLSSNIKTLSGWVTMRDISVGDALASVDGKESVVTGVYPQGQKQIYEIVFSDGRRAECCAEHLWRVMYREWDEPRVLSTARIIEMLQCVRYKNRLWIDCVSGDFGLDDALPIHPWVLGAMLGDGTFSKSNNGARFSTKSPEIVDRMNQLVAPLGVELVYAAGYDWRIVGKKRENGKGGRSFESNGLRDGIKELGLFGVLSHTKFIPKKYLCASKESRLALLQGLLDTDGWIEKWGSIRFSSASKQLADDVVSLVRSLGGVCSLSEKKTTFSYNGEKKSGMVAYCLCISLNSDLTAFTLTEKTARVRSDWGSTRRVNFKSITPSRMDEAQCIMVSHPSHTYITNDYVVTHNTTFAMNIAEHVAPHKNVVVFSQEMGAQQLGLRLISSVGKIDIERLIRDQANMTGEDFDRMAVAVETISKFKLHIDDQPSRSLHQVRSYCRSVRRKYGELGLVVIDYLQLMAAEGNDGRHEAVAGISRGLKVLAKELNVPVIALSQLNRSLEQRPNKRPVMSDLRESGQIEQDADVIAFVYRDEVYNPDTPDKGVAEIIFGKVRMGKIGTVAMSFTGELSRFNNLCREWAPQPPTNKKQAYKRDGMS